MVGTRLNKVGVYGCAGPAVAVDGNLIGRRRALALGWLDDAVF